MKIIFSWKIQQERNIFGMKSIFRWPVVTSAVTADMRWVSSLTSNWFWSEFNGWDFWKRKFCTKMWELLWHGKKVWHLNLDHYEQVSGSLDGKLIVWDSWTGNKIQVDSKFVVMCFRNGGLHASWHRWSPWSLRGWWPLPSRQAATWSRAGAWTTCSPCTTSTAGLASQSSHPVNWVQYKKQHNIFLFPKRIESPAFCNFCLQGCQRSGEACQRDSWVSILFPIWHLCNSYFQGVWHTGVSSKSDVVDWWQRILFQIWRFSFLCEIPWRWQRPHRCKTFFRQCYLLNVSTPHTRLVP